MHCNSDEMFLLLKTEGEAEQNKLSGIYAFLLTLLIMLIMITLFSLSSCLDFTALRLQ